jgi:hypothetical protein
VCNELLQLTLLLCNPQIQSLANNNNNADAAVDAQFRIQG